MGRPREFNDDDVLNALRDVFWEHGYEGTSYADIMAATDLKKGSLYADKTDLIWTTYFGGRVIIKSGASKKNLQAIKDQVLSLL